MLKKTIAYTDYNGTNRTEDFYFNLTRTEIAEMEYNTGTSKSFTGLIQEIVDSNDIGKIISIMKELILKSYGVKSDDGRRFIKNDDVREAFEQNPAFDELYMELSTDPNKATEFITGIIPSNLAEKMNVNGSNAVLKSVK